MRSYLRLLLAQLRVSVTVAAAYRFQFVLDGLLSVVWIGASLLPLTIALRGRAPIGDWTYDRALVVVGVFALLKAVLDGVVSPSLVAVVDHIRKGTLDFLLMKPKDAQFLICTSKFELWRGIQVAAGATVIVIALRRQHVVPTAAQISLAALLILAALVILYSLWLLVVTSAFWVVRLDNLAFMFNALFDFARWPRAVMKGALHVLFTFVLPLAAMTSYPAEALLGLLRASDVALSLGLAFGFAAASRFVLLRALRRYTSASS